MSRTSIFTFRSGIAMGLGLAMCLSVTAVDASARTATDVLDGARQWKLNGYTGTLRVGNSNNGLRYADSANKNDSHYFFERDTWAVFRCYAGNPTSGGSSNPRSELRELTSNGSREIYWDGTDNREDSMRFRVRVDDLPPSGKLCFAQIHARGDDFDDVIRVQVEGDGGQNSGRVKLRILGYASEELQGSGQTVDSFRFNMDTGYSFELIMRNKIVSLYKTNIAGRRTGLLYRSGRINSDENYFKLGCYLQSTKSEHRRSNVFGQTRIKNVRIRHR